MNSGLRIPNQHDQNEVYRQQLRLAANQYLGGKESVNLTKMELIEAFVNASFQRDQWRNAAMSMECQLYMSDPCNPVFKGYPEKKLEAMNNTVLRWKKEIAEAEETAKAAMPQLHEEAL